MRKLLIAIIILSFPVVGFAQYNWDIGVQAGAANYLGEMGGKGSTRRDFVADMKFSKTQFTAGGFARYKFSSLISAQIGLNWVRVEGADNTSTNPGRVGRNLSFSDDIIELSVTGQVFFYEMPDLGHTYRYRNDFKMYAFGGVAPFYYNPKTYYNNEWVKLRPLATEGKNYSAVNVAIPIGLGMLFTIDKHHRIGWEFNWRTTFTDYIDDVSGNYANPKDLSPESRALANRRLELGNTDGIPGLIPAENNYGWDDKNQVGYKRGDPSHKDSYLTTSVYYSYVIRGKSSLYKSKYGSIFRKAKGKKKKIRAKF